MLATNQNFLVKKAYCCVGQDFWKKKHQFFRFEILLPHPSKYKETYFANRKRTWSLALPVHSFLSHLHFFKVGEIMSKYGHLMLPGAFLDKVTPDIDFMYRWSRGSVFWCSCSKNTFVGAVNLRMTTSKFWYEYLWGPYVLFLDPVLSIVFSILRRWSIY